ncbi:MAG: putative integral membrane protein (TIGR00697 family) [Candidatus Azotimanducaceae bacterium]|jgi:uncharacterized integral membrane protein (TIGR00697 family)
MNLASSKIPADMRFCILACAFMASWGMMQLFVVKLVPMDLTWIGLGVTSFVLSEFLFAITFPITDVVTEVWGAKRARLIVYGGALVNLFVMLALSLAVVLPSPDYWQPQNDAYSVLYQAAPRIWLASITAVVVSQLLDIYVFNVIRSLTGERMLWVRNNGSTLVSQAVDTVIFYMIAFYGLVSTEALISLLVGNYLLKIVLSLLDTPLVYLLVKWARGNDLYEPLPASFNEVRGN